MDELLALKPEFWISVGGREAAIFHFHWTLVWFSVIYLNLIGIEYIYVLFVWINDKNLMNALKKYSASQELRQQDPIWVLSPMWQSKTAVKVKIDLARDLDK